MLAVTSPVSALTPISRVGDDTMCQNQQGLGVGIGVALSAAGVVVN